LRAEHWNKVMSGNITSIRHKRKAKIRELVAFPKRNDLWNNDIGRIGGASRPFLSAEAKSLTVWPWAAFRGPG
jgi:hypothetical protein